MFEAMSQNLTSVTIFPAMRNALEWLLCGSTTILAYNSNMAVRYVAEVPQKYENAHNSFIIEASNENFISIAIFPPLVKTMEWPLCESTITLAYNSNVTAK